MLCDAVRTNIQLGNFVFDPLLLCDASRGKPPLAGHRQYSIPHAVPRSSGQPNVAINHDRVVASRRTPHVVRFVAACPGRLDPVEERNRSRVVPGAGDMIALNASSIFPPLLFHQNLRQDFNLRRATCSSRILTATAACCMTDGSIARVRGLAI